MKKDRKRNPALRRAFRLLRWIVLLAIVGTLVALSLKPKPIEIDAGTVVKGPLQLTVDNDGETRVRERYTISAPLPGQLLRIALEPGDAVKQGDVLATIVPGTPELLDPRSVARAEAAVHAAEAAITSAETQRESRKDAADQLRRILERNRLLHERGNIPDATLEESESAHLAGTHALAAAGTAVEIARFELEQAKAALLRFDDSAKDLPPGFEIHAPIDGQVLRVDDRSSRIVQPGTVLLELGDPTELEMRIDVLSQDAVRIRPGQEIIVAHWGGVQELSGRVRRVSPSAYTKVSALGVDEQRVDVLADFEKAPPAGEAPALADRYRIEARIVVWEKADAVQVPAGALFREGDNWAVYRVIGDRARLTELELGPNNGEFADVLSGLDPGDRVVLHPGDRIADETLIQPRP